MFPMFGLLLRQSLPAVRHKHELGALCKNVHQASNLKAKGKGGLNDSYATIQLGKEKYQTSIKESTINPEWQEECDLSLSDQSQTVKITIYHRNLLGLDEFVGEVAIPLQELQVFARPSSRWYHLKGKPGSKNADKERGKIEVTVTFIVQNTSSSQLSLNGDIKTKKSISFRNLAHTVGDKLNVKFSSRASLNKYESKPDLDSSGVFSSQSTSQKSLNEDISSDRSYPQNDEPPLSRQSSKHEMVELRSARNSQSATLDWVRSPRTSSGTTLSDDWPTEVLDTGREAPTAKCHTISHATGHGLATKMTMYELHEMGEYKKAMHRLHIDDSEVVARLSGYEREDLVRVVVEQRVQLTTKDAYIRDLEDYIDDLLVKVMETQPKLLQNPYVRPSGVNVISANNKTIASTVLPDVYLANARNKENSSLTGFVAQGVKSSKSSQQSTNGKPLKFISTLINAE